MRVQIPLEATNFSLSRSSVSLLWNWLFNYLYLITLSVLAVHFSLEVQRKSSFISPELLQEENRVPGSFISPELLQEENRVPGENWQCSADCRNGTFITYHRGEPQYRQSWNGTLLKVTQLRSQYRQSRNWTWVTAVKDTANSNHCAAPTTDFLGGRSCLEK